MARKKIGSYIWTVLLAGMILPPLFYLLMIDPDPAMLPKMAQSMTPTEVQFSFIEQAVISVAAFGLKPLYTLLALVIAIWLWKEKDADLVAIRYAMIAFFLGENCCAVNFLFFNEMSFVMEYLHSYGMLLCFGFFFYGLMKTLDMRVLKFTAEGEKCTLLPLCKQCYKYADLSCRLRQLFLLIVPATALISLMPLTAELGTYAVKGDVFDSVVIFGHPLVLQIFEVRVFPLMALPFFALSFIILLYRKEAGFSAAKILYAMGLGPLSFGMFRFILFWAYERNPLWADVWEELTEFIFIAFIFLITWLSRKPPQPKV